MRRTLLALLFGTALLGVGLACGAGEDEPTLTMREYFAQMLTVRGEMLDLYERLVEDGIEASQAEPRSDDARIAARRERTDQEVSALEESASRYHAIAPPHQAENVHNAYAMAVGRYAVAMREFSETDEYVRAILDMPSMEVGEGEEMRDRIDAAEVFLASVDTSILDGPLQDLIDACGDLTSLAEENGVVTELCVGGQQPPSP